MDRAIDLKLDDMKDEENERERRQNNVILTMSQRKWWEKLTKS